MALKKVVGVLCSCRGAVAKEKSSVRFLEFGVLETLNSHLHEKFMEMDLLGQAVCAFCTLSDFIEVYQFTLQLPMNDSVYFPTTYSVSSSF